MRQFLVSVAFLFGLGVCGLFCGCEGSPDTENVGTYFDGDSVDSATDRPGVKNAPMEVKQQPLASALTNNGQTALFSVIGASGAVTWSVQDISKGSILTQGSTSATYQRSAAGDNVVIAMDSHGNAAFAAVSQP